MGPKRSGRQLAGQICPWFRALTAGQRWPFQDRMPQDVARSARYMAKFRCLGGECEDTCCQNWTVPIDEPTHRRLKLLASTQPLAQQMLATGVELTPGGPHYGKLVFSDSGRCGMLDDAGLCGVHAQLGPDALFDTCMVYPRYYNEVDGELELFGTLSCPEVARLCLLGDDSLALEQLEGQPAPRKLRNQLSTASAAFKPFTLVRGALVELLSLPDFTFEEKLFALLWVCDQLSPLLHSKTKPVPLADLATTLKTMLEPAVVRGVANSYLALTLDGALALSVIDAVMSRENPSHDVPARFARYAEQRGRVSEGARARIELATTRFAINHLYTTPYMMAESLFAFARDLVWRVAVLRSELTTRLASFTGDQAAIDREIVEVTYRFARRVEHSELLPELGRLLQAQRLSTFAHTIGFLRV